MISKLCSLCQHLRTFFIGNATCAYPIQEVLSQAFDHAECRAVGSCDVGGTLTIIKGQQNPLLPSILFSYPFSEIILSHLVPPTMHYIKMQLIHAMIFSVLSLASKIKPSALVKTTNYSPLVRVDGPVECTLRGLRNNATTPSQRGHARGYRGLWFIDAEIAGEKFPLLLDTGSSDTFIFHKDFKCLTYAPDAGFGNSTYDTPCVIGKKFDGNFPDGPVPDVSTVPSTKVIRLCKC